jgi:hypothetical protein
VRVGTFDFNGDKRDELVIAPGVGAPPVVQVPDGTSLASRGSFFAFSPEFLGGVNGSRTTDKHPGRR